MVTITDICECRSEMNPHAKTYDVMKHICIVADGKLNMNSSFMIGQSSQYFEKSTAYEDKGQDYKLWLQPSQGRCNRFDSC